MESEKKDMRVNVLDHEPGIALFVPDDDPLVFYRAVACWSRRCLLPGGMGMAEINERLGRETSELFREAGFSDVSVVKDLNDRNRFVNADKSSSLCIAAPECPGPVKQWLI